MNQEGRKGGGEFLINLPCYIYGTLNLSCLYCQQYLARNVYYPHTDTDSRKDHTKPRKHFVSPLTVSDAAERPQSCCQVARLLFSTLKFSLICLLCLSGGGPDQRMRPVGAGDLRCSVWGLGWFSQVSPGGIMSSRYCSVYTQSTFASKGRRGGLGWI